MFRPKASLPITVEVRSALKSPPTKAGVGTVAVREAGVDWRAWPFTWHKLKAKVNKCSILVSYYIRITEA